MFNRRRFVLLGLFPTPFFALPLPKDPGPPPAPSYRYNWRTNETNDPHFQPPNRLLYLRDCPISVVLNGVCITEKHPIWFAHSGPRGCVAWYKANDDGSLMVLNGNVISEWRHGPVSVEFHNK